MSGHLFTVRDLVRISDSISPEEAMQNPAGTRYLKDMILRTLWPAVITSFYPPDAEGNSTYTLGAALRETHLYDFFQYVYSQQWINIVFDRLEDIGIGEEVLTYVRDVLRSLLQELFKYVLGGK